MPVPVSVLPVRARMVLSLWISSHEPSTEGIKRRGAFGGMEGTSCGNRERDEKERRPFFTKAPPRERHGNSGIAVNVLLFAVIAIPPLRPFMALASALYGFDDGGVGAAAAKMRRRRLVRESVP